MIMWLRRLFGKSEIETVVFEEGGRLVAVCLEPYLVVQGDNWEQLVERLREIVRAHVAISIEKGLNPFRNLRRAPQRYRDLYAAATFMHRVPITIELPEEARARHGKPGDQHYNQHNPEWRLQSQEHRLAERLESLGQVRHPCRGD